MNCCTTESSIIVGAVGELSFQLSISGKAYPFQDATTCVVRLVNTDNSGTTGSPVSCADGGDADWRSGFGVCSFTDKQTQAMVPGIYRLEIETVQPTAGKRKWQTSDFVNVVGSP